MAESVTIARPYAEAVFRMAKEQGALAQWSGRLQRLALVAQDKEIAEIIGNPKLSAGQLAELFISLADDNHADLTSFIRVLADNERLILLPEVYTLFEAAKSKEEGIKDAVIETAFPLDDAQVAALLPVLEAHFQTRLAARVQVAPELIGGVRVAVGDQVLDTSVRNKLETMATALKN
jgi:F-type H+-transporting ATPase subunit delta